MRNLIRKILNEETRSLLKESGIRDIKNIAKRYSEEIKIDKKMPYNKNCSYHFYWILVKNRTKFRKMMTDAKIETGTHYRPIHTMSMYKNKVKLETTEKIGNEIVVLPTHPNLSNDDVNRIISTVNSFSR